MRALTACLTLAVLALILAADAPFAEVDGPPAALEGRSIPPAAGRPAAAGTGLGGEEYFALAEDSYEMGDYARARDYYLGALGLLYDSARLARTHERLAFIHAAFDETEDAYREFVRSLLIDPALLLDPDLVSPKVYEAYARARDEVVREGTLVVNCDPPGAEVFLDGEPVGEAPATIERLSEGEYKLRLVKPGYESSEGGVTIKKDVTLTIDDKLARARGSLTVSSSPAGVQVALDGRPAGVTPVTVEGVSGGPHTLSFRREYFEPVETGLVMEKGEAATCSAVLPRRVLVVTPGEGAGLAGLMEGQPPSETGVSFVWLGIDELRGRLAARGLDLGSLEFINERKTALELEDVAALSGIMEDARVELVLAVLPLDAGAGYEVGLTLYGAAGSFGDSFTLSADDPEELKESFRTFMAGWRRVADPYRPSAGMRLVDRASGGAEVISVTPGWPAAAAGLMPGDVITAADGAAPVSASRLSALLADSGTHAITYERSGREHKAELSARPTPVETPLYSVDYLYNLALVQSAGYLRDVPAPAGDAVDEEMGHAALNLGNARQHTGEYKKAVEAYELAHMSARSGICDGTAYYRMGEAYERLGMWPEAAYAYRRAMLLYPDATIESADGPPVAPLALERLKGLFDAGLTKERWWE